MSDDPIARADSIALGLEEQARRTDALAQEYRDSAARWRRRAAELRADS